MLVNFISQEFAKEANRKRIHEENVPATQTKETQHAWLPCAHGHEARKSCSCSPSGKGKEKAHRERRKITTARPTSLKTKEILRGRDLFKRVATEGKSIDSGLLRCRYVVDPLGGRAGAKVLVGFKVSSRDFNAVRRNRLKRLLREAMRKEYSSFHASLPSSSVSVAMVLYFKDADDILVKRLSLADVWKDVRVICQSMLSRLSKAV